LIEEANRNQRYGCNGVICLAQYCATPCVWEGYVLPLGSETGIEAIFRLRTKQKAPASFLDCGQGAPPLNTISYGCGKVKVKGTWGKV